MKQSTEKIQWHEVYNALALQLLNFYKKHKINAGRELFNLLKPSTIYLKNNSWLINQTRLRNPSLDPIQLFVSFSRSGQKDDIRTEIINIVWKLLSPSKKLWDRINYEGCPAPIGLKLQYFRPEEVQMKIWDTFYEIMTNGRVTLTPKLWDEVKTWRGIEIPAFTIFLFWIDSERFVPMDKNTRQYLEQSKLLSPNAKLSFDTYQGLLNNRKIEKYTILSLEAYYFNNDPFIFQNRFRKNSLLKKINRIDTTFRLLGVRILSRNKLVHKILKPHTYYPFDYVATPATDTKQKKGAPNRFKYNPASAETLYHIENLKVNITAIVGKNGSGKSTLLDLILMGIYNMSVQLGYIDNEENKLLKNLNFEIYWHTDVLYKIVFSKGIHIYAFKQKVTEDETLIYELDDSVIQLENIKADFFYTILVNYSHYALNSSEYRTDWITPLSHKNDGYITPVVINPKRTEGDIEINNEKTLLNMRLLLNLLELHDADIPEQSFRYIDNNKYLKSFSVQFDERKNTNKAKENKYSPELIQLIMKYVCIIFSLKKKYPLNLPYKKNIDYYIVSKLLTIVDRYNKYRNKYKEGVDDLIDYYSDNQTESDERKIKFDYLLEELLQDIKGDKSHITSKIKQAIYYLKYPSLQKELTDAISTKSTIALDRYKQITDKIINSELEEFLTTAELLPPAIFMLDFYLDDKDQSSFSKASSGEFQLVSVLSSVLYHLRNISSIDEDKRYRYVAILLDEIELYFHPNMQRFFIKKLLEALSKMQNELYGIQILLATHSPFILSDIQQQKILKLKNGTIEQNENGYNTFAANIHDLLADEFFLEEGNMGAFAQKQIETAINLLNYINVYNELKVQAKSTKSRGDKEHEFLRLKLENELYIYKEKLVSLRYWNSNRTPENLNIESEQRTLRQLIDIIGEPLIKEKLGDMYRTTFANNIESEASKRNEVKQNILNLMRENNINLNELQ